MLGDFIGAQKFSSLYYKMKLTLKSKSATSRNSAVNSARLAEVKGKGKSAAVKANDSSKGKSAVATVSAAVKALKKGAEMVALLTGAKGNVFRKVKYLGDGKLKLIQRNDGLTVDNGATFSLDADNKLVADKEGRVQAGNYICSRGERATVKLLSFEEARKFASRAIVIERNGHEINLRVAKNDSQYVASIERMKKGEHFFQWESKRITVGGALINGLHFGALVKG